MRRPAVLGEDPQIRTEDSPSTMTSASPRRVISEEGLRLKLGNENDVWDGLKSIMGLHCPCIINEDKRKIQKTYLRGLEGKHPISMASDKVISCKSELYPIDNLFPSPNPNAKILNLVYPSAKKGGLRVLLMTSMVETFTSFECAPCVSETFQDHKNPSYLFTIILLGLG